MDAAAENRMPVAMRLPRSEVEAVVAYARENRITKTDASLHFLRLGLNSDRETRDDARLAEIERLLGEVLDKVSEPRDLDASVVKEAIREEARRFPAICKVVLFGSFARGDATSQSDIDLRLVLDRPFPFSLYDLARFQKSLAKATGRGTNRPPPAPAHSLLRATRCARKPFWASRASTAKPAASASARNSASFRMRTSPWPTRRVSGSSNVFMSHTTKSFDV